MRRLLILGGTLTGAVLVARPIARRIRSFDMAGCVEAMPDTAPPKWMFTNISAIRRNTERILEILDAAPASVREAPISSDGGDVDA